jgi:energy-coupling factor transporter ATP-binding protein EcfA2
MSTDHGSYNIRAIRQLMVEAFTPQTLRRFCQDRAFLHSVLNEFAPEQGLNTMVDRVIDFCETQYLWERFLPEMRHSYPRQYARFESELGVHVVALAETACPYRGLEPFEAAHAEFYFGREATVKELVEKVGEGILVAVIGPSGCGKSSLVRAGLVTALREGALPGCQDWEVRIFRPGQHPVRSLSRPLVYLLEPEATEVERLAESVRLANSLQGSSDITIDDIAARLREKYPEMPFLLLVVDQFEEVYTECRDKDLRDAFVMALLGAAKQENISVVLTLRGDFYGHVMSSLVLGQAVKAGRVDVLPMTEEEFRRAIEQPAIKTAREFEPGLVERILEDVVDQPGSLPLMEFALTELWDRQTADGRLTHEAYEAIGKVEGSIAQRAEAVYEDLADQGQGETAKHIFLQLTHYGEGVEGTRRQVPVEELVTLRTPREQVDSALKALTDARLLVTGGEALERATAEVSHEALIRGWERLGRWLDEERAFGLWREKLAWVRRNWEETERDEGALLRGAPLSEAEIWFTERGSEINSAERNFIEKSLAYREEERVTQTRQQRWMRVAAAGATVGFAALVAFLCLLLFRFLEIPIEYYWLLTIAVFGLVGMVRGFSRELKTLGVLLVGLSLLGIGWNLVGKRIAEWTYDVFLSVSAPTMEMLYFSGGILFIAFVCYYDIALSLSRNRPELRSQAIPYYLGGLLIGLCNGYLVVGTVWRVLANVNYFGLYEIAYGEYLTAFHYSLTQYLPLAFINELVLLALGISVLLAHRIVLQAGMRRMT